MRGGIVAILFLIIVGVMLANIIANPTGTKVVLDGFTQFWSTSVNGLLANGSTGGR
jgi:hypothetical protein